MQTGLGFNNHVGVPLTLAALPVDTPVAVQEMGMNAPGEIADLSLMAGPDIALITCIADSHAGFFASLADIAAAKAEIFDGLCGLGVAVLNRDDEFFDELSRRAKLAGANRIISFGASNDSEFCLLSSTATKNGRKIEADCAGVQLCFSLGMRAPHWALNAIGILAVIKTLGLDVTEAARHLVDFSDLPGRGAQYNGIFNQQPITLVDDSYNAGPASMRAALAELASMPPQIMVLSDMLELGDGAGRAHDALVPLLTPLMPREVIALGPEMGRVTAALAAACPTVACYVVDDSDQAINLLARLIQKMIGFLSRDRMDQAHIMSPMRLIAGLNPTPENTTDCARHAGLQEGSLMLPDLLVPLAAEFQPFNLFRYITFRTGGATITSLILSSMFGPMIIRWLKTNQEDGQPIRYDGPESHLITKVGTPTMGGLLILGAFALSTILWMPLSNPYLWPVLAIALSFGVIGSVDDWMKAAADHITACQGE